MSHVDSNGLLSWMLKLMSLQVLYFITFGSLQVGLQSTDVAEAQGVLSCPRWSQYFLNEEMWIPYILRYVRRELWFTRQKSFVIRRQNCEVVMKHGH